MNIRINLCKFLLSSIALISAEAFASNFNNCKENFLHGAVPVVINKSLNQSTYDFCYNGFANKYSGITRTGLWSAHYLSPERIRSAKTIKRENNFHEETRIPMRHRALLSDYRGSGYDRGHLLPSGDSGSRNQQNDSFVLNNIIPQSPNNNQNEWNYLEQSLRGLIQYRKSPAYVITGSLFLGETLRKKNNLIIPSHVYKVVYFPNQNVASAWVAVNDDTGRVDITSVSQLEHYAGMIFFPTLQQSIKDQRVQLPFKPSDINRVRFSVLNSRISNIFTQYPNKQNFNVSQDSYKASSDTNNTPSQAISSITSALSGMNKLVDMINTVTK